jgi:hypothetical protein
VAASAGVVTLRTASSARVWTPLEIEASAAYKYDISKLRAVIKYAIIHATDNGNEASALALLYFFVGGFQRKSHQHGDILVGVVRA